MTADQFRAELRRQVQNAPSVAEYARSKGISPSYIADLLSGRRGLGPKGQAVFGVTTPLKAKRGRGRPKRKAKQLELLPTVKVQNTEPEYYTEADVRAYLGKLRDEYGQVHRLAQELGIAPAFLSDVINGFRTPGNKTAKSLGFERVIVYKKLKTPQRKRA